MARTPTTQRGFTLIELAATLAAGTVLISLAGAISGSEAGPRDRAMQLKEASQLRGIGMSFVLWAAQNRGQYPLPSAIDRDNTTVAEVGRAKDHSANMYSMLIYNGSFPGLMAVSPAERNPNITPDEDYMVIDPKTAVDPDKALWDPAFSVDFTGGHTGNTSFAHLELSDARLPIWSETFQATQAVLATRGPEIASLELQGQAVVPTLANDDSITLSLHKPSGMFARRGHLWGGHVAYNDSHIEFAASYIAKQKDGGYRPITLDASPASPLVDPKTGDQRPDVLFYDEPGYPANIYLGLFTTAGPAPKDFTAIWD